MMSHKKDRSADTLDLAKTVQHPLSKRTLRRRAEVLIREQSPPESLAALSPEAVQQMFHELQVHQIELEMQNEELRRAQAELDAARERYFDLYDLAPVGYVTLSEKGLILEANLTAATLLGVARGTLARQPFTRFIIPEDQDIFYRQHHQLFATGAPQTYELRMLVADADPVWARLDAAVVANTMADAAVDLDRICHLVLSDITERKRAEEYLRQMIKRFDLAACAAHLGVWDWDIVKDELVWDDPMYALYGVGREEFTGAYEAWLGGLHPDDRAHSDEISKQALRGEREYDAEFRVVWPDGSLHYLKAYGQVIRDADGAPRRMIGVNFDITAHKQQEALLAAQLEELRRWYDVTLGREKRILELKREVNRLLTEAGKPARYASAVDGGHE